MDRIDPERTLLCGILAVQIGLIKRPAQAAALREWTRCKDRALAEILVEQGALDVEGKVLVEALALKHLELHGDNPEKSLAVLQAGRSTRASLAGIGDPDVEATLTHVGSDLTIDGDRSGTDSYAVGTATSDGQRAARLVVKDVSPKR